MLVCPKRNRDFADTIDETHNKFPLQGNCTHKHPESLPGYIDVEVLQKDGEYMKEPDKISVAQCLLKQPELETIIFYESYLEAIKHEERRLKEQCVDELEKLIKDFNNEEEGNGMKGIDPVVAKEFFTKFEETV